MFRNSLRSIALAAGFAVTLGACTTGGMGPKQGFGTVGGAIAGGLAGSQIGGGSGRMVAVGVGTLLGAFVGNEIGASLDRADRLYMQQAAQHAYAAPIGQPIRWHNPNTGNRGTITPVRDGQSYDGAYCREFQQTITVGGRSERAYGTACRQPDGAWRVVNG